MRFKLVVSSQNRKTGPIAVISSSQSTCPNNCPLKDKYCYGLTHPLIYKWRKVGQTGLILSELLRSLGQVKNGSMIRYGDVGDLPGDKELLNEDACIKMANKFNEKQFKVFGFTHYSLRRPQNLAVVHKLLDLGFTINASTTDPKRAVEYVKLGIPTVLAVAKNKHVPIYKGIKFVSCFATQGHPDAYCLTCGRGKPWCWRKDRNFVITFEAHGTRKNKMSQFLLKEASNGFYVIE